MEYDGRIGAEVTPIGSTIASDRLNCYSIDYSKLVKSEATNFHPSVTGWEMKLYYIVLLFVFWRTATTESRSCSWKDSRGKKKSTVNQWVSEANLLLQNYHSGSNQVVCFQQVLYCLIQRHHNCFQVLNTLCGGAGGMCCYLSELSLAEIEAFYKHFCYL